MGDRDGEGSRGPKARTWVNRSGAPTDGRLLRGERTRLQIIDATIELIHAGNPQPTSAEIAGHAGISGRPRTMFSHFGGLEVFCEAAYLRIRSGSGPILPAKGPLDIRVRATCRQRRQLFEASGRYSGWPRTTDGSLGSIGP